MAKKSDSGFTDGRFNLPFAKGTQTRKFFGKAPIDKQEDVNLRPRSNSDHAMTIAAGMNAVSRVAEAAAAAARRSLGRLDLLVREAVATGDDGKQVTVKGTKYSKSDLNALQNDLISSILAEVGLEGVSSEDARKLIASTIDNIVKRGTILSIENKPLISSRFNRAVPEIDFVRVVLSNRGIVDKFSAELKFTLSDKEIRDEKIKAVRIFRSKKTRSETVRPFGVRLSRHAAAEVRALPLRTRNKNHAKDNSYESMRFDQNDVRNSLSLTTTIDEFTGLRSGLVDSSSSIGNSVTRETKSSDEKNMGLLASYIEISELGDIDASVINDLRSVRNIQIQNPDIAKKLNPIGIISGGRDVNVDTLSRLGARHMKELRKRSVVQHGFSTERFASNYKELTIVPISKLKSKKVGSAGSQLVEFTYVDSTVELGGTYTYYVTTLDETITESTRSKIAKITIEDVIPPAPPKSISIAKSGPRVTISMLAESSDKVMKFEVYRKLISGGRDHHGDIQLIDDENGFTVGRGSRNAIDTGYIQVGECINTVFGGASFTDRTSTQGKKYIYRIYSVDIYGNKSQSPKEVTVFVDDHSSRAGDIIKPTILSEVDVTTKAIKITITNDDERAVAFFIERRDNTIHERAFTIPTQPSIVKFGDRKSISGNGTGDVVLNSRDNAWTGYFVNEGKPIVFFDKTARVDHTYQYRVYSIDRYGHKSSFVISPALFIPSRPLIDTPINLTAVKRNSGIVTLTWDDSNIDIDPEDRIGNRDVLEKTAYRTLYQVERKKKGSEKWEQFPLTEHDSLDDKISLFGETAPTYRPSFLEIDEKYLYRVAAMQTGNFISNFSDPVEVSTFTNVGRPAGFRIKTCDTKCEPFYVALNWNTPNDSGTVDKWKIERAVVNNFAAAKLNVTNVRDIEKLNFEHVTDVHKESSRARARVLDIIDKTASDAQKKSGVLSGQHHYIDSAVEFGNTYFYRVTAVGIDKGNVSEPVIRGIRLTDPAFERKLNAVVTQNERDTLTRSMTSLKIRNPSIRGYSVKITGGKIPSI